MEWPTYFQLTRSFELRMGAPGEYCMLEAE
jgi:hypothetical protein